MLKVAAGTVFEKTRENAGATRHANRGGVVVLIESDPVRRELIDVRSFYIFISIATERIGRLIVRKKKDEIELGLVCAHRSREDDESEKKSAKVFHFTFLAGTAPRDNSGNVENCTVRKVALGS